MNFNRECNGTCLDAHAQCMFTHSIHNEYIARHVIGGGDYHTD